MFQHSNGWLLLSLYQRQDAPGFSHGEEWRIPLMVAGVEKMFHFIIPFFFLTDR
jgi:hypothetical protein